jgi:cell division protein FtsX
MDWDMVNVQLRLVGPFLRHLMANAEVTRESRFEKNMKFTGYSQVLYEIVRPGGSRSIFPNVAVPNALVCQVAEQPVFVGGVRRTRIEMTNPAGIARVTGMLRGWDAYNNPLVEVYQLDGENAEVIYALNKPKHTLNENQSYGRSFSEPTRREKLEMCRVQGLALLDVVDPGRLVPLRNCTLLAGRTESKPLEYSSSNNYLSEPHRVLFAEPGSRIKMLFREGQLGLRLAILDVAPDVVERLLDPKQAAGVTLEEARGRGIQLGSTKIVDWLPLRTATDLWSLGEKRIQNLRTHSIGNARLDNPAFPGKYSEGRVTVTERSRQVKGEGVSWDERILGMPFRLKRDHLVYTVEKLESPDVLVLNAPYDGATAVSQEFVLTREKPGLHNLTYQRLEDAVKARRAGLSGKAWQLGTEAWGIESRAYPEVLGTANDSVLGVVFYLFLLLPFCFFLERLLFASPRIEKQIALFFTIFVLMFAVLWLVHPAFELVAAPPIILLAFVIMSLSGIVTVIVYGKFNTEMRLMQQGVRGVQSAEVNRASAVLVAVSLGISQMRRRRVRTALTCVTVVLLTFIALSFTSTVQTISQAHVDLSPGDEKDSPYSGILLRQLNFDALRPEAYEQVLRETAGVDVVCAPRYWLVAKKDQQLYVDVLGDSAGEVQQNDRRASPSSLVGLSPEEIKVFPKIAKSILKGGRWLQLEDRDVCLLSERIVKDVLNLDPAKAIGTKLRIGSYTVELIGVFNSETLGEVKDLDGETLSPADFSASAAAFGSDQQPQGQSATVENLESAATAKYIHVDCADTVIVPWRLGQLLGADLRSVGVRVENDKYLQYLVDRVLQRLEKNIYVGKDGRRQFFASTGKMSLAGLGNLVVPLLISVLILLNTMIGAVYERGREITIFSSLGLAPSHIAALFMAEALVYATLGAIFGYLVGQGVAKIIQMAGISGLYLNYSSSSAVFVTAIVMLSVLGSTLYPAILAARAAAPSEERSWGVPEPKGDEISLELPFSFQRDLVPGVVLFLHEFFDQHSESTLGKFTAKEVTLEAFHTERGQGICLFFMAWLTPYDLGVSQEVQIYIIPETENLYVTEATFYRVSGYVNSWRRVNLPFLNALRKHFLIWRTYSAEQRQEYAVRGYYQFIEAFDAVGWPAPEGAELPEGMPQAELDEEGRVVGDSGGKGAAPAPA